MTQREFTRRRRKVSVEEREELVAVLDGDAHSSGEFPAVLPADKKAMDAAGWRFVARDDVRAQSSKARRAKVFVRGDQTLLATGKLTAKFRDDVTRARIDALLAERSLTITGALTFANNYFEIDPVGAELRDAIDLANELLTVAECELAEPVFIEVIGQRPMALGGR